MTGRRHFYHPCMLAKIDNMFGKLTPDGQNRLKINNYVYFTGQMF